jgi:hypothetical protein
MKASTAAYKHMQILFNFIFAVHARDIGSPVSQK